MTGQCSCTDGRTHGYPCKHVTAVLLHHGWEPFSEEFRNSPYLTIDSYSYEEITAVKPDQKKAKWSKFHHLIGQIQQTEEFNEALLDHINETLEKCIENNKNNQVIRGKTRHRKRIITSKLRTNNYNRRRKRALLRKRIRKLKFIQVHDFRYIMDV